jgi:hypothetical protein
MTETEKLDRLVVDVETMRQDIRELRQNIDRLTKDVNQYCLELRELREGKPSILVPWHVMAL